MKVRLSTNFFEDVKSILTTENCNKILLETASTTVDRLQSMKNAFEGFEISLEPILSQKLTELRQIKSAEEIEKIKKAQEITDSAFGHILNFIKVGKTEKEISLELEFFMRKNGSEHLPHPPACPL